MRDVLKALEAMQGRFYRQFGDIDVSEFTQHEKHLTWMQSYYLESDGCTEKDKNKSFVLGYRIGVKEQEYSYDKGYQAGIDEMKSKFRDLLS